MEQLYRKVGDEYIPVKEFTGFPANGFWLVDDGSRSLITYLGDAPKPFVFNYACHKAELVKRIVLEWEGNALSAQTLADISCDYFAEFAFAEKLKQDEKEW